MIGTTICTSIGLFFAIFGDDIYRWMIKDIMPPFIISGEMGPKAVGGR